MNAFLQSGSPQLRDTHSVQGVVKPLNKQSTIQATTQYAAIEPAAFKPSVVPMRDYVYVLGSVQAKFPNPGLRREFERALRSSQGNNDASQMLPKTDDSGDCLKPIDNPNQYFYQVFSQQQNRYIAREMAWYLLDAYGNECYQLNPGPNHLSALINALKPKEDSSSNSSKSSKTPRSMYVVGIAYDSQNPDSDLPELTINRVAPASPASIIKAIIAEKPHINVDNLKRLVAEILSLGENPGDSDAARALNYLLYRNLDIYSRSYDIIYGSSGDTALARLNNLQVLMQGSGDRTVAKVVFDYQSINGGAGQSYFSAVDVTDEFPFLLVDFRPFLALY